MNKNFNPESIGIETKSEDEANILIERLSNMGRVKISTRWAASWRYVHAYCIEGVGRVSHDNSPSRKRVINGNHNLFVALAARRVEGEPGEEEIWCFTEEGGEPNFYRVVNIGEKFCKVFSIRLDGGEQLINECYPLEYFQNHSDSHKWRRATDAEIYWLFGGEKNPLELEDWSILDKEEDFSCLDDL
jgi:hypothetical protein